MADPGSTAVLVVEDESIVAHDIQKTLESLGYDAFAIAASSEEAVARAEERRPDVVLMDVRIKGGADGITAAEVMRGCFECPVVFLTAHADDATIERARLTEPYGYLLKPVRPAELKSAIEVALYMHEANLRLRESEQRYRDLVENSLGLITTHDLEGRFLSLNPAAARILGYEPAELVGRNVAELIPERFHPEFHAYLERIQAEGRAGGLLTLVAQGGAKRVLAYQNVLCAPRIKAAHVLSHAEDITERVLLERQLREQSLRDPLTGCHNRRYLAEFEKTARPGGRWGCLLIDIDHFKQYNDTHGHRAGDEALVTMSRFLQRGIRAGETVVRMGGDEFLVLLGDAEEETTKNVADRIRAEGPRSATVGFTIGWAVRQSGETLEDTIHRADRAMFTVRAAERFPGKQRRQRA